KAIKLKRQANTTIIELNKKTQKKITKTKKNQMKNLTTRSKRNLLRTEKKNKKKIIKNMNISLDTKHSSPSFQSQVKMFTYLKLINLRKLKMMLDSLVNFYSSLIKTTQQEWLHNWRIIYYYQYSQR